MGHNAVSLICQSSQNLIWINRVSSEQDGQSDFAANHRVEARATSNWLTSEVAVLTPVATRGCGRGVRCRRAQQRRQDGPLSLPPDCPATNLQTGRGLKPSTLAPLRPIDLGPVEGLARSQSLPVVGAVALRPDSSNFPSSPNSCDGETAGKYILDQRAALRKRRQSIARHTSQQNQLSFRSPSKLSIRLVQLALSVFSARPSACRTSRTCPRAPTIWKAMLIEASSA
jgi:hypothetical protein